MIEHLCVDCGRSTLKIKEYYMVHDSIWESAGMDKNGGMLCLDCLEKRLGRNLNESDFPDYPVNKLTNILNKLKIGNKIWNQN